jgi:hypothetical protein
VIDVEQVDGGSASGGQDLVEIAQRANRRRDLVDRRQLLDGALFVIMCMYGGRLAARGGGRLSDRGRQFFRIDRL